MEDLVIKKKSLKYFLLKYLASIIIVYLIWVMFLNGKYILCAFLSILLLALLTWSAKTVINFRNTKILYSKGWGDLLVSKVELNIQNIRVKIKPINSKLVYWAHGDRHYDLPVKEELGLYIGDIVKKEEIFVTGGNINYLNNIVKELETHFGIIRVN